MALIDESAPRGASINSEIKDEDKFVIFTSFKQLCYLLKKIGNRGWIWVVDAVDAYYRVPIQERFQHLFGIEWLNRLLIFKCLSFGLSTAPAIYNRFADIIMWACKYWKKNKFKHNDFFHILHYLDDFFGGHKSKSIAHHQKEFLVQLFEYLNILTNPKKVVGPTQLADILGWSCKTNPTVQIGLAESKRLKYIDYISIIISKCQANFKEFEKLIGYTRHTCNIYLEGNKFVRGLERQKYGIESDINDPTSKVSQYTKFKLSPESIFDLKIWLQLYTDAKHRYIDVDYILVPDTLPQLHIFTDASTSYGAGGYIQGKGSLYHLPWAALKSNSRLFNARFECELKNHIIYLELFAVVLMAYLNAPTWKGKYIHFWCDNMTTVKAVEKGTLDFSSKLYFPKANLIKLLARLALKYGFHFTCHHIPGKKNQIADALSRNNDLLRNMYYNKYNQKHCIPVEIANKLIVKTCVNRFSAPMKF